MLQMLFWFPGPGPRPGPGTKPKPSQSCNLKGAAERAAVGYAKVGFSWFWLVLVGLFVVG